MSEAIEQLRNHQRQHDEEGIFVGVSRQALEETLEQITALQAERDLAIKELTTVVNSMKEYLFPDNHSFIPLTDIRGLVSQADNISCQIPVVLAELAALKAAQQKAWELMSEVVSAHADPNDSSFNDCGEPEKECLWCIEAKALKPTPPAGQEETP